MSTELAEQLRTAISASGQPLLTIATACGIPYSRLHSFVAGKDIRLSTAQKLADHFGLELVKPRRRPKRG